MSGKTTIEWTDTSWNPSTGCDEVSPGCDRCYAKVIAERFRGQKAFPNGFDLTLHPERLVWPIKKKAPQKIFVNSMSDLLHKDIPDDFILQCFETMLRANWHIYQILTKRPGRLADSLLLSSKLKELFHQYTGSLNWPAHIWYGVSVESDAYRWRIGKAVLMRAPITFVSAEPLLEELHLSGDGHYCPQDLAWLITGCESGHGARPMSEDWVRSLRDQCLWAGTKFFYKQKLDERGHKVPLPELDGRQWNEFPEMPVEAR